MISLTKEEREKFAAWLQEDADGDLAICTQLEKLPSSPAMKLMIDERRMLASVSALIVRKLRSIEDASIG